MLLYTDGVVEVRGEALDAGLERLRRLAEREHATSRRCATRSSSEMVADGRPADDVALLAVRLAPLGDHAASRSWPADADVLASVRHLLRRWLRHHGATDDEIYDITVACQEACANAVEHAYAPGRRGFEVEADHDGRRDRDRRPRPRPLARRARDAPRARNADDARR